jgi:predicted ATPase
MLALYRCGRQADALAAFQRCRRRLDVDLGIEPGPHLQALEAAVLRQSEELAWRPTGGQWVPATAGPAQATLLWVASAPHRLAIDQVESAAEAAGGEVVHTERPGRPVLLRFESASAALRVAVDLVRTTAGQSIPGAVAVHTGPAVRIGAELFGPAVDDVTRLAALAHDGQAVVSEATVQLVGDQLSEDVLLRNLGMHRLRDRTEIERVYQLCAPGLADTFPPLRTSADLIGLPVEVSSFFGREAELDGVRDRLRESRLVTLVGPGGSGKTRLALRAARQSRNECPDGVLFVDLAPLDNSGQVPDLAARSLRLHEGSDATALDAVVGYLRERRMLVVLDNCEHLAVAAAEFAAVILSQCTKVRILTTSREPLRITGEAIWPVPMMTLPVDAARDAIESFEATRLFCERAQAVAPDFKVTDANAHDVVTICRRLDGLPLAIELAAARVRMLSPAEIAARLDDRFTLLGSTTRAALARHRTLRAVVEWSYEQLDERARRLLAALSVFPGSFSLDAAEAVGGLNTLELVADLTDRSLVQVIAGHRTRYRLLETIRAYAVERLDADSSAAHAAHAAHCAYFAALAERASKAFIGDGFLDSRRDLEAEHENLRTAVNWAIRHDVETALLMCGALATPWAEGGRTRELEKVAQDVLAVAPSGSTARADALGVLALTAMEAAEVDRSIALLEEARRLARSSGNHRVESIALLMLGSAAVHQGNAEKAAAFDRMLSDIGDTLNGLSTIHRARLRWETGDRTSPYELLDAGTELARATGNQLALVVAARVRASVAPIADREEVMDALREAVEIAREGGLLAQLIWCLHDLASCMWDCGDLSAARQQLDDALRIATEVAARLHLIETRELLARLELATWRVDSARSHLDVIQQSPDAVHRNRALRMRAELDWLSGHPDRALDSYRLASETGPDPERASAMIGLAVAGIEVGEPVDRDGLLRTCDKLQASTRGKARAWHLALAARALRAAGELNEATDLLRRALGQAEASGSLPESVGVGEQIAYLVGDRALDASAELLGTASALRERIGMPRSPRESRWHADAVETATASRPRPQLAIRPGRTGEDLAAESILRPARRILTGE